jgi:hypothetical protein
MTQKIFFLLVALFPFISHGQTVHVEKRSSRVHGDNVPGYQVALSSPEADVRHALEKYLKLLGKTKYSDDVITTMEPVIAGNKYVMPLYATTRQVATTTAAWIGMNYENGEEGTVSRDLEKLVYDFGVTFYRDKIQSQLDESMRALQTVERQQTRLVNQNKDLSNKIEGNKREKIELEKSLVENKIELEELTKKLQANVKAQDSIAVAAEQIRKVVAMHKEKQQKVN